eukprot:scaffold30078_cov44-Cyclotella_meneghiniana.AAC.3
MTYSDGDPKDLLIELEKELIKIAWRYDEFNDGSWERLVKTYARCLKGRIETIWIDKDKAGDITHASVGNASAQETKCKDFIKAVNAKYLGKNAADVQKDAMVDGEIRYEGHSHEKAVERLFEINKDVALLHPNVQPFDDREMIRKVLNLSEKKPSSLNIEGSNKNLKPKARLEYVRRGRKDKSTANEVIDLCLDIEEYLDEEIEYENEKKSRDQRNRSNNNPRNNDNNRTNDNANGNPDGGKKKNPCRRHNREHDWDDCPDNWKNKNRDGKDKKSKDKKEVTSTEDDSCANSNFMVQSDDESISDGSHSTNEFMEVTSSKPTDSLHPITVIAAPDKEGKRTAAKILMDQCCTDQGLISFEFAKKLGLSTRRADKDSYITAAGLFETHDGVELSNCMSPCLSSNRTFSVTLKLIPEENSKALNYGVILGQEAMRKFDMAGY